MRKSAKHIISVIALLFTTATTMAQESDWEKEFQDRAKQHFAAFEATSKSHFEQMRGQYNEEYADMMNGVWQQYDVIPATPQPLRQEPRQQPKAPDPKSEPFHQPIQIEPGRIVLPPIAIDPVPLNLPKDPKPTLPKSEPSMKFDFFGMPCEIGLYAFDPIRYNPNSMRLGDEWKKINGQKETEKLIDDCLRLREAMSLCDIGYLWLCEKVAEQIYPSDNDSQAFLTSYLLNQSGYDVKLGLTPKGLTLLMATDISLYGVYKLNLDNKTYYIRNRDMGMERIATYDGFFAPKESIPLRIVPDRMPNLDPDLTRTVTYSSKRWTVEPEFTITVSKPEMEFFKDYPWMSWENYVRAPVSDNFRRQVIETMRSKVKGLSTFDGVRKLLSYVQFGFEYMTDLDQYQHEKVNFPEENFYYPANDCEDRAILFSTLVREIYGLDVVLLHYDKHLSTAVDFRDPTIQGDAMNIDGHHYVMCDPTFIGARIGMSMPQYRGIKPEVYRR